ncbi:MAG: hypothetical protein AB1489_27435 [Acidobacteriota bacterium]
MVKETLRALDGDVQRLLLSGGALARNDEGLRTHHQTLTPYTSKVPALAKIAEQLTRVIDQGTISDLLDFGIMTTQVQHAQAQPGCIEGDLSEMPTVPPLDTPLPHYEVELLHRVLIEQDKNMSQIINDAIDRQRVCDLRLWQPFLDALSNVHYTLADTIAAKAIPLFGDKVVPLLIDSFNIKGSTGDGRRLTAIVKLRGIEAKELLLKAIKKGSAKVSEIALEALAEIDWVTAEPIAQDLLRNSKNVQTRNAAAKVLRKNVSDETLDLLLDTIVNIRDNYELRQVCETVLYCSHPEATKRLLDRFPAEVVEKLFADNKAFMVGWVFIILKGHFKEAQTDERTIPFLVRLWQHTKFPDYSRMEAGDLLLQTGNRASIETVAAAIDWPDRSYYLNQAAVRGVFLLGQAYAYEKLAPKYQLAELQQAKSRAAAEQILYAIVNTLTYWRQSGVEQSLKISDLDPRWFNVWLTLLESDQFWQLGNTIVYGVLNLLGMMLNERKDPRALPALINALEQADYRYVLPTLRSLDDRSAAPQIRAWASKANVQLDQEPIKGTLEHLERDRSGN